jgi:hypothetical protein
MATEMLHESAVRRALRDFRPALVNLPGLLCGLMWTAISTGTTIYLSAGRSVGAQAAIAVVLLLAGFALAALTLFGWSSSWRRLDSAMRREPSLFARTR